MATLRGGGGGGASCLKFLSSQRGAPENWTMVRIAGFLKKSTVKP
jgi:hypothetical protein